MNTPVTGTPRVLLRLEGVVALVGAIVAYRLVGGSRALCAGLFLVPDLSMLGYLMTPKRGAIAYNVVHTYLAPDVLAAAMAIRLLPEFWPIPLIWISHIGLDRALGFGLKYPTAFRDTHLH